MVQLTDDQIRDLWDGKDPTFGTFGTGVSAFRLALKEDKKFDISLAKLRDILNSHTAYLDSIRRKKKFAKRKSEVDGYNQLVQIDLGFITAFNK